jgi:SAM-dependent methyltransferase
MLDSISPPSHLIKLAQPQPDWHILILTGANPSLALDFASYVSQITLVCPTAEQVHVVGNSTGTARLSNIVLDTHDPEFLPYDNDSFDLLICHHMIQTLHDTEVWLRQVTHILRPQGLMAMTTHLVPGTRLRGKKARKLRQAGDYLNAFNQLRNPQHQNYYSQNGLEDLLIGAGFDIQRLETADKLFYFAKWIDEAALSSIDRLRLKVMLVQAPEKVREFLTLQFSGDRIQFRLPEITILAKSKANTN